MSDEIRPPRSSGDQVSAQSGDWKQACIGTVASAFFLGLDVGLLGVTPASAILLSYGAVCLLLCVFEIVRGLR